MRLLLLISLYVFTTAHARFDLEESHTTASLRGIDSLGAGIAWASGANGTVRRTEDGGYLWQLCTIPPGAEALDFRAIQAADAQTALVMSSGKGALSRVYRTTDGCQTWTLLFTNPDPDGFWDGLRLDAKRQHGILWGDPIPAQDGSFVLYETFDAGLHWTRSQAPSLKAAAPGIGGFAASNSTLSFLPLAFATGGPNGPYLYLADATCTPNSMPTATRQDPASCLRTAATWRLIKLPMSGATATAGIFSFAQHGVNWVAVGGDFSHPEVRTGTAAFSSDRGLNWLPARSLPAGYRSAVAYDEAAQTWLAVGPTGSDISRDNGQTWQPILGPAATGWNAISLPFVVGARGRIARVQPNAFAGR